MGGPTGEREEPAVEGGGGLEGTGETEARAGTGEAAAGHLFVFAGLATTNHVLASRLTCVVFVSKDAHTGIVLLDRYDTLGSILIIGGDLGQGARSDDGQWELSMISTGKSRPNNV